MSHLQYFLYILLYAVQHFSLHNSSFDVAFSVSETTALDLITL